MVVSVESGIYLPDSMGIRLEDVIVVTNGAPKVFGSPYPREINVPEQSPRTISRRDAFEAIGLAVSNRKVWRAVQEALLNSGQGICLTRAAL